MGWILKCALISENTKHFRSCKRGDGSTHACNAEDGCTCQAGAPVPVECTPAHSNAPALTAVSTTDSNRHKTGERTHADGWQQSSHQVQLAQQTCGDCKVELLYLASTGTAQVMQRCTGSKYDLVLLGTSTFWINTTCVSCCQLSALSVTSWVAVSVH
jgi:hypothetical protein